MSATGLTAGAAALGLHPAFWIVLLVLSAVLGVIALHRYGEEQKAVESGSRGDLLVAAGELGGPRPLSEPDAPAGVLADIEHLEGCPREPARMEQWTKARERNGIEVMVGKCNDCGAMAYRHGDRPERPPTKPPSPLRGKPRKGKPKSELAKHLAKLHLQGQRLDAELKVAAAGVLVETLYGQDAQQVERERQVRGWDLLLDHELLSAKEHELWSRWRLAGTLPREHRTLSLIEPTINLPQLRTFVADKMAALREIIESLGDPAPTPGEDTEREREPTPVDRLHEALERGMALRTTLAYEDQGHWEGDKLVRPVPGPISEDPVYVWARRSYDLLWKHFGAYADDFFGDDPTMGRAKFMLAFHAEVEKRGRQSYLERRIDVLKQVLKAVA